ncbi:MAG: hypothetical protein ACNA8W_25740, partial [Bradymonadaceae bacterium]
MNDIGPILHGDRPRVVAFGGGKGGVGRSSLCSDIARAMTRHHQRILCVDVSWASPTLNILLGGSEPRFDFSSPGAKSMGEEGAHVADFISETAHANVWLASLASSRRYPFVRPK